MTLKDWQKIWEDIYNGKIRFKNNEVVELESKFSEKYLKDKNKDIKIKIFSTPQDNYKQIISFIKKENSIFILPDGFNFLINNVNRSVLDIEKGNSFEDTGVTLDILGLFLSGVTWDILGFFLFRFDIVSNYVNEYVKKYDLLKNKELLKSLYKQQVLMSNVIRDFYYKEFQKHFGRENLIKLVNKQLTEKEKKEIYINFNPEKYKTIEPLLEHIEKWFNENKNINPDKIIPDNIYDINIDKIYDNQTVSMNINRIKFGEEEYSFRKKVLRAYLNNIEELKMSDNNEFFTQIHNKKDFINLLKENYYFNNQKELFNEITTVSCRI